MATLIDEMETEGGTRIVEIDDERGHLAEQALELIGESFAPEDRQPLNDIALEIAEKRLGLLTSYDFHLFAARTEDDRVMAISAGVYLQGVNSGFVTYLAVKPEHRARNLGRQMRAELLDALRADARRGGWQELDFVIGEVRHGSPWLARLLRERSAVAFPLHYYHPGILPGHDTGDWVLYRQPIGDFTDPLPAERVKQLLYAIWRRAYRVRYPLEHEGFKVMLAELDRRVASEAS